MFYVALTDPTERLHEHALAWSKRLPRSTVLVTTDHVLGETLTFLRRQPVLRDRAVALVRAVRAAPTSFVVPATRHQFEETLEFYASRRDKQYSFVDCVSFVVMADGDIEAALTEDQHFQQEGFRALLRETVPN